MSEKNRKRCRKSKLTLRECNGVDNEELNIVQILSSDDEYTEKKFNSNDVVIKKEKPCSSSSLDSMDKIESTNTIIKKEIFDEDDITDIKPMAAAPPPMEFSIKVEIENFDEEIAEIERLYNESKMDFGSVSNKDDDDDEKKFSEEKSYYSAMNIVNTSPVDGTLMESDDPILLNPDEPEMNHRITEAMIIEEIDRISKESTSEVDRKIQFGLSRYWQRPSISLPEDYFDSLIQENINKWKIWHRNSRGRCIPFLFKCYVCKLGWWRLFAFREHVAKHVDDLSIECEFLYNECNLIAFLGPKPEIETVDIFDGSDCPLCGECYDEHVIDPTVKLPYVCKHCLSCYTSCQVKAIHQSQCYKYKTQLYNTCKQHSEVFSDEFTCPVCKLSFYTERLLNKHMFTHLVWSDIPNENSSRHCLNCNTKAFGPNHICTEPHQTMKRSSCVHCNLQFKRKFQYQVHNKVNRDKVACFFCGFMLKRSCMDLLHYCVHSENYVRAYRCNYCEHLKLSSTIDNAKRHASMFHPGKKYFRAETDVVIPKTFLEIIELEEEDENIMKAFKEMTHTKEQWSVSKSGNPKINEPKQKSAAISVVKPNNNEKKDPEVAGESEDLSDSGKQIDSEMKSKSQRLYIEKRFKTEKLTSVLKPIKLEHSKSIAVNERSEDNPVKVIKLEEAMESCELDIDVSIFNPAESSDGPDSNTAEIIKKCRCNFEGTVQGFEEHKTDCYHHQAKACTKCGRVFPSLTKYLSHFATDHGLDKNACPECFEVFPIKDKLNHVNSHIKQIVKGYYIIDNQLSKSLNHCVKCNAVVEKRDVFQHWESHLNVQHEVGIEEEPLENYKNSITVTVENTLEPGLLELALERICTRGKLSKTPCMICGREFLRQYEWKRHIIEHLLLDAYSKTGEHGLECQICRQRFQQSGQYKCHMREHANFPMYKCYMCNKTFSDSSNFAKHKKVHNISVLVCDICQKKFQIKKTLIKHMELHAKSGSKFQCDKCDEIFPLEVYLRKHKSLKHDGKKPNPKCHMCRQKFPTTKERSEHMWDVHKLRQYKADCPVCGASYRKLYTLKQHLREEHGDYDVQKLILVARNGMMRVEEVNYWDLTVSK